MLFSPIMFNETDAGKRGVILNAALRLFTRQGFHGSPTSAIAKEAGVGVGTIYRYFKDKESLIHELCGELHLNFQQQIMIGHDPTAPLVQRYHQIFATLLTLFIHHPAEFRFMELYYYSSYAAAAESPCPTENGIVYELLSEVKKRGLGKEVPMRVLEALAWGPVVALAKEHSTRSLEVSAAVIEQTVQASWDAVCRNNNPLPTIAKESGNHG